MRDDAAPPPALLPERFSDWFAGRGWAPRPHQIAMVEKGRAGRSALLIAPTGGGKTLAGFLASLIDLAGRGGRRPGEAGGLHTLYISPLKALAVDIARNLEQPVAEMALPIRVETRTGDTPSAKRQRQRRDPPDILLTTPEQLALLISHEDAGAFFRHLNCVILDELHALTASKRGDLLALGLARLRALAPAVRTVGLSATVRDPEPLQRYLAPQTPEPQMADLVRGAGGADADVSVLASEEHIPWSGHSARHAFKEIYEEIKRAKTTLVFVNTRSQAEIAFSELWRLNDENLPIALHHGSLDVERRRKVEAMMGKGGLRAVVCTSTLDLGIDWGEVDLVVQIGAPKGSSRLIQRVGRANHRMDEPSRALLVPGNRFEVLECRAAKDAIAAKELDGEPPKPGGLDVLAQHVVGRACSSPFDPVAFYEEITSASPYADLPWETYERVVDFCATGGYALRAYDRHKRLVKTQDGKFRIRNKLAAQQHRMNIGTIVEIPALNVRLTTSRKGKDGKAKAGGGRAGRILGTIEEWFIEQLGPGDTFYFAGEILEFQGVDGTDALVTRSASEAPKIPSWQGGKFPLTTYLANRVRRMVNEPESWPSLPGPVREWLELQEARSIIPKPEELLVETFFCRNRHFLVCYPFDGRLAHQSMGMLLTRRLERMGLQPLGFCPTEYALSVYARKDLGEADMAYLFDQDMLGEDLDLWLADAQLMRRTFRNCAVIAGLIERNHPGQEKTGRQVSFSSDLIYNVLREHEPDHILLEAAWNDAAGGFLDIARLQALLARVQGNVRHIRLDRVSPLAVPVMLEVGREAVFGVASDAILEEISEEIVAEATA
ncbi:MAG: ligase-associated DNA damage response DEXH box helicase [Pseudomonadota bacterium]